MLNKPHSPGKQGGHLTLPAPLPSGDTGPRSRGGNASSWAVLLISLVASGIAWYLASTNERQKAASLFDYRTDRIVHEIQAEFAALEDVVRTTSGMVTGADFGRSRWRSYFLRFGAERERPALHAIAFAPLVDEARRGFHEDQVRAEGVTGYRVLPAGQRPRYLPVAHLRAPVEPSAFSLGQDLLGDPAVRADFERALVNSRYSLIRAPGEAKARWFLAGAVSTAAPAATGAGNGEGLVVAALNPADLVRKALGPDAALVAYRFGALPEASEAVAADLASPGFDQEWQRAGGTPFRRAVDLPLGDRTFRLELVPMRGFYDAVGSHQHEIVLVAGLLVSALLFSITRALALTRREALSVVERRTRELQSTMKNLAESETTLRAIVDNAIEGIIVIDTRGAILSFNRAAERTFGFSSDEVIGRNVSVLMPSPDRERHDRYMRNYLDSGIAKIIGIGREVRGRRRDGSTFPLDLSISEVRIGERRLFCGIVRDITERQRAQAALRESEERFRSLCESAPVGIFQTDAKGDAIYVNDRWCELSGLKQQEAIGGGWVRALHPEDRERVFAEWESACARAQPFATEYRFRRPDGTVVWLAGQAAPLRDESGTVAAYLGTVADITGRKMTEEALAISERKLRSYIHQSLDGLLVVDGRGRYLESNPAVRELMGYSEDELHQLTIADTLSPEPENLEAGRQHFARVVTTGRSKGEVILRRRDGGRVVADINAVALGNDRYLGILRDVTARRQAEQQLQREREQLELRVRERTQVLTTTNEALQQEVAERKRVEGELVSARELAETAAEAKTGFLANMSHEIRTPLNTVIGTAALLEETPLTPEQKSYLDSIRLASDTLLAIISDILDFSKIDSGALELESRTFELATVIEESLDLIGPRAADKDVELVCAIGDDIPPLVVGDPMRLRQVLVNLVGNAIKFTDRGEIVVRVARTSRSDGTLMLRFAVRDTGVGIPRSKFGHLFKPFTQADSSTTRKYGGTGLGLAICSRLVRLMDGEIWVESVEGQGSEFTFTIVTQAVDTIAAPAHYQRDVAQLCGRSALIVDDNAVSREVTARMLRRWGMTAFAVPAAETALACMEHDHFDVVLIDQRMPGTDGEVLAARMAAHRAVRDTPRILMGSILPRNRDSADERARLFRAQIRKPIKHARLFVALLNVLGGGETDPEIQPAARLDATLAARLPMSLLVAEDSDINRRLAVSILEKLGYRPQAVDNGLDAVRAATESRFDLILMDLQMPGMDGLEATRRIRASLGESPRIVAMTANATNEDRERCLGAGMDDFISKPVLPSQLQQTLEHWGGVIRGAAATRAVADPGTLEDGLIDRRTLAELASLDEAGKASLHDTLIRQYLGETPAAIADVRRCVSEGDYESAARRVHRLAGASTSVGASGVAAVCRDIESVVKAGVAASGIEGDVVRLEQQFTATRDALEKLVRQA